MIFLKVNKKKKDLLIGNILEQYDVKNENHIKDFAKRDLNNESLLILGGTGLLKTLLPELTKELEVNNVNTKITILTRNTSSALKNIPVLNKDIFDLIEFDFLVESEFKFNIECTYILYMAATAAHETLVVFHK